MDWFRGTPRMGYVPVMHHVAIMKPSWKLIPKILSGEKTIESRWYQTRRAPWNGIAAGDVVYFKDSGEARDGQSRGR